MQTIETTDLVLPPPHGVPGPKPAEGTTEIELVWKDPPGEKYKTTPSIYMPVLDEIKKRPGKWARIRIFAHDSTAYSARKGLKKRVSYDTRWEISVFKEDD